MTIKDVAAACKLSETAVRRAISDGELPAVKLRSRLRIMRTDFDGWIASQRQFPLSIQEAHLGLVASGVKVRLLMVILSESAAAVALTPALASR